MLGHGSRQSAMVVHSLDCCLPETEGMAVDSLNGCLPETEGDVRPWQ